MRKILILQFLLVFSLSAMSQKISNPNYGLKSPSSAEILWVDYRTECTEVCVKIRNEIENGFFCIEHNTRLIKPDGTFVILKEVEGLPFCPDIYRFKKIGEEIVVRFIFPATHNLSWFSLVEECSGGCFKFLGVTTDELLNTEINKAYVCWESDNDLLKACNIFTGLIEKYDALNLGIEGLLYANVVELYNEMGNSEKAKEWHSRMLLSNAPDLNLYIDNLKSKGISI
jgi:hypothetical protein